MSKSRPQPMTGGVSHRRTSTSPAGNRAACTMTHPMHGPSTQSHNRRVTSVTTNCRNRPMAPSRPKSSERLIPDKKTSTKPVGTNEHLPRQFTRQDSAGNQKSPRNQNRRPPFVVGTGSSNVYRGTGSSNAYRGAGSHRAYATMKAESHSRSGATSSKDRHAAVTGSVPKDSGTTELKANTSERPAAHATETMTLVSSSICDVVQQSRDRAEKPNATESSATFVVADPLPEVFFHRTNRKQHHPSADECIKQVAEKLNEFAATQNNMSDAAKSGSSTGMNSGQHPLSGNNVTKDSYFCDVVESPRKPTLPQDVHLETMRAATTSSGNDVNSASKRVGGTTKKAAEVHRNGSTRLTASCRPSPTRSSLLRQAHNRPGSAATQQRVPRPTRPTAGSTHLGAESYLQTSLRQHATKHGRGRSAQHPQDATAQLTK